MQKWHCRDSFYAVDQSPIVKALSLMDASAKERSSKYLTLWSKKICIAFVLLITFEVTAKVHF